MNKLVLGLVIFFGVHSISMLALGWRNRIAERLGTRAWQGIYSVIALIGFYLLVAGYGAARSSAAVLYATPPAFRYLAALLMLPVFTLALASVFSGRIRARAQHPLLLAAMLWSVAHLLTNGSVADLLLFGAFLAWTIAVRVSLAHRPPRAPIALPTSKVNDAIAVVGGLALYAVFMLWLHARWLGVPPLDP
ncbi:MAG TPA: NnrU family protein [Steroidobacteraceae bacterium]|nr:NnrU family protein [Steroidobacteraceae bacterium]